VAHPAGDMDPGTVFQRYPFPVNEEVAAALDAQKPVGPGMLMDATLSPRLQGEQPHDVVVPEPALRPKDDLLSGIFDEMSAHSLWQVPDIPGILPSSFREDEILAGAFRTGTFYFVTRTEETAAESGLLKKMDGMQVEVLTEEKLMSLKEGEHDGR